MDHETESELLSAWREGTDEAGDRLLEDHKAKLGRFITRKLYPDADAAHDVFQSVVASVYDSRSSIETYGPFIWRTASNQVADYFRNRGRTRCEVIARELADERPHLENALEAAEMQSIAATALRKLSEEHQQLLLEKYVLRKTLREMRVCYDRVESTIHGRVRTALQLLRKQVQRIECGETSLRASAIGHLGARVAELQQQWAQRED